LDAFTAAGTVAGTFHAVDSVERRGKNGKLLILKSVLVTGVFLRI
jgi:hypothetical protein